MTTTPLLSGESQRRVAEEAVAAETHARAKARKYFKWSAGLFAASATVGVIFPPAALPGLMALICGTAGIVTAAYGSGHRLNAKMLAQVKTEAGEAGFADKMKARAERLGRIFKRADKWSDRSLYGAIGLAAAAWLAPPVAPLAWGIYSAVVCFMAGATLVRAVTRDPSKSAQALNATTQELAARDGTPTAPPPANTNTPVLPGLSPDFAKAVNGPAPAAEPAHVQAPPPPKP